MVPPTMEYSFATCASAFETLPDICVTYCAEYLDRCSQGMFSATNKRNCQIVKEKVTKRWPLNPGEILRPDSPEPILVVPSPDCSRIAVCYDAPTGMGQMGRLDLWDVTHGKLGSLDRSDDLKPVFSPNSQILLIGPSNGPAAGPTWGLRMVSILKSGKVLCTKNRIHDRLVRSVSFVDNETITYNVVHELDVKKRKIVYDHSGIPTGFSPEEVIFEADLAQLERFEHQYSHEPLYYTHSASFKGANSVIHLLIVREYKQFFVYNETHKTMSIVTVPNANGGVWTDPAVFSQDGSQLVISFFNDYGVEFDDSSHLAVLDCDFESNEPVPSEGQSVSWVQEMEESEKSIQFLSGGMILRYFSVGSGQNRISLIDLEKGQILSTGWNEATWQLIVGLPGYSNIQEPVEMLLDM